MTTNAMEVLQKINRDLDRRQEAGRAMDRIVVSRGGDYHYGIRSTTSTCSTVYCREARLTKAALESSTEKHPASE